MRKYFMFAIIFFGYGAFNYNRKSASYTIPELSKIDGVSQYLGLILSAQNLAYAIGKFMGGIVSDRHSPKLLFSLGLIVTGLAAMAFPLSDSIPLFVGAWFLNGLAQGLGWPPIVKLLRNWFKPDEIGFYWSAASASANVAGVAGPYAATYLITKYDWRMSMYFAGIFSIATGAIAFVLISDEPESSAKPAPSSPAKNQKGIEGATKHKESPKLAPKSKQIPFKRAIHLVFAMQHMWVLALCYFVASCVKTHISDWSRLYLMVEGDFSSDAANLFLSCFELGGFAGGILAGILSDKYLQRFKGKLPEYGHPRMDVALLFSVISVVALPILYQLVTGNIGDRFLKEIAFVLGATVYAKIAIFGILATQSVCGEISGTAHAFVALAANAGSVVAGLPFAEIAKAYSWSDTVILLETMVIATTVIGAISSRTLRFQMPPIQHDHED